MSALNIQNLHFNYENNLILKDLNLIIKPEEKVGLIGSNGCGKTTLFLTICGILAPQKGLITVFNKKINQGKFYPNIGFVFQNPNDQLFCPTVRDDIIFGAENLGLSPTEIQQRLSSVLEATGVAHLQDRVSHQLSGGEKCMVAIASILIMQPKLILYDEPSANLDLKARRRLINFLQSSLETLMISSHDLEMIREVCNRVILLNNGQIIADGYPDEIMSNEELMAENCLEVPASLC
ncbi:MAG: ABC transporter ATP-binding protein [Cyanobacterium sp. T60_A2020_053]|nr:ABC transporter ATP-binding protein [Cyanobacterium sp. T60_A2020_053]